MYVESSFIQEKKRKNGSNINHYQVIFYIACKYFQKF